MKTKFYGIQNSLYGDKAHIDKFCIVQNLRLKYHMGYITPAGPASWLGGQSS